MRVAIIGYGKMGREVERILLERGHEVALIVDAGESDKLCKESLQGIDVAIEFTAPSAAYENIHTLIECGIATVSGTTGWGDRLEYIKQFAEEKGGALFYASNYSLGVNLLFRLNRQLAAMVERVGGYEVAIEEVHHTQKIDSPSGTAITLAEGVLSSLTTKNAWVNYAPELSEAQNRISQIEDAAANKLVIESKREGNIVGIHTVKYEAVDDSLTISHTIKNRRTLALGAVVAAEFLCGKVGFYTMDDLLN